jgi:hypothetical protein
LPLDGDMTGANRYSFITSTILPVGAPFPVM